MVLEIKTFLDRIEGDKAVLYDDDENQAIVPAVWIPNVHEGQAVTLHVEDDPEREKAALEDAQTLLNDLEK